MAWRWLGPLLVVGLLAFGAPPARAAEVPAHWADRRVVVRDEVGGAAFRDALRRAVDEWNRSGADLRLAVAAGTGRGCGELRVGEVLVCGARYEGRQLGATRTHLDGDRHIYAATVLIDLRPLPPAALRSLLCHELGHAIGLAHRAERSSCLHEEVGATTPDDADRRALRARYAHQEPSDPCGRQLLRLGGCG